MSDLEMQDNYDFSKSIPNPYINHIKKPITIRLENETVDYFKSLASETGIPYQTLMNMFLSQCAREHKKPLISWK